MKANTEKRVGGGFQVVFETREGQKLEPGRRSSWGVDGELPKAGSDKLRMRSTASTSWNNS